jgi:hypothetical protein
MSISELDLYCRDIATCYNLSRLSGIRAKLQGLLKSGSISTGIYQGLNRDIRDRADWLKRRV